MNDTFKKINIKLLSAVIALLALFGLWAVGQAHVKAAADYSADVVVTDWNLSDSNGNPASETNPVKDKSYWKLDVSWTLEPNGATVQEGDTFSIALPTNSVIGTFTAMESTYEDFMDSHGTIIGQWRVYNNKIQVVFNANATGATSISGEFATGQVIWANYVTGVTQDQTVTMGKLAKTIAFVGLDGITVLPSDGKYANNASNSQIQWGMRVNWAGTRELAAQPWGTTFTKRDTYIEDTLGDGTVSSIVIQARIAYPRNLTTGEPGQIGATTYQLNVTGRFTKITQNDGETYAAFKARLEPLQYGIYTDGDGVQTVVIYFGVIGGTVNNSLNTNGLKYSNITPDYANVAASSAINSNIGYTEADRAALVNYFTTTYGDGNVINGNVASYTVYINENYNKVVTDTDKSNTAILTQDGVAKNLVSAPATLRGNLGSVKLSSLNAGLYLSDYDNHNVLPGANFKLQILKSGTWSDYTAAGTLTTNDSDGFIQTPDLGAGTYRFVQLTTATNEYDLKSSEGYDSTLGSVVSDEFTVDPTADEGPIVSVTNVKYKYDITYTKGAHGTFEDESYNAVINTTTPAFSGTTTGETGYSFTGWSPAVADKVTAKATYTAQWQANSYNITYILNGGTNDSSNPATYTYGIGVASFAKPTRTGYTFLNWQDTAGNTITNISTTDTGNKTLIANWEANVYDITYQLDGGTNDESNPDSYTYSVGVDSFANPVKEGYNFLGWQDTAGNPVTNISKTATGAKTLIAEWEANVYDITYQLDGGTNDENNPNNYTYGIGVDKFNDPVKEGYTFLGWVDEDGNVITNISKTAIGAKTLIATWEVNNYKIVYTLNGGTNDEANPNEYTYGIGVDSFNDPTREGYTFLGWVDADGKPITSILATAIGDKILIAQWEAIPADPADPAETKMPGTGTDTLLLAGIIGSLGLGLAVLNRKSKQ